MNIPPCILARARVPLRRFALLATITAQLAIVLSNAGAAPTPAAADLRGYGKVSISSGPSRTEFTCESPEKAEILQGKLLADMFWDAKAGHVVNRPVLNGKPIAVHEWQPYGAMLAARIGSRVIVLAGENTAAVVALAQKEKDFDGDIHYEPARPYPVYLDLYDLRAFKTYVSPMTIRDGVEDHWAFIQRMGLGGVSFKSPSIQNQGRPAPGVVQLAAEDYERRQAEKNGGLFIPCPVVSGQSPLWLHNLFPNEMMLPSPTSVIGAWGGAGCAGATYSSWGMTTASRAQSFFIYQRQIMEDFLRSPALGGWHFYGGSPGNESTFHDRTTMFWDYSLAGQDLFRRYLRDVKGLDLAALSRRWYGTPNHFRSWNDVAPPDVNSFFGDLDENSLLLNPLPWHWRARPAAAAAATPPVPDAAWVPVQLAPSQKQNFLPWGAADYAVEFNAADWLAKNPGRQLYLACSTYTRSREGVEVWLNDKNLGSFQPENPAAPGAFGVKVTGLIRPGENRLVLRVPSGNSDPATEGKILGPVFLTTTKPQDYPYDDPHKNARYIDVKLWQRYGNYYAQLDMFNLARALDPDRPFLFSSHGDSDIAELAQTYGAALQNTGREAYYFPWNSGLGPLLGVYGASEASGNASGPGLARMFGWMMIDADSHHDLYHDLDPYIAEEQAAGWFTKNKRSIELFGKYLRVPAPIVIFRSSLTQFMGSTTPASWDIGRGELQASHFDNFYATEREVEKGLIAPYPVLFDAGTEYMEPSTVQALRRYVEQGGTFVAIHSTGRHGLETPNTWPISALTGFQIVATGKGGPIRFESDLPILKAWAGMEINGDGDARDHKKNQSAKGVGLALQAAVPEAQPLARWADGSVAVGIRPIGKGRVILLGSTFWRSGRDVDGVWATGSSVEQKFFDSLFSDLGIRHDAKASEPAVWARKMTTKNGLEDWVVAFNSDNKNPRTADISLRTENKPEEVLDMAARTSVPFTYADGMVTVSNTTIEPNGLRVFGARRAPLGGGVQTWWAEKTKYWQACDVDLSPIRKFLSASTVQNGTALSFDQWRFRAVGIDGDVAGGDWMQPSFDDQSWRQLQTGAWNLIDPALKDYGGTGFYRREFTMPAGWTGRDVMLGLYSFDIPIVFDEGEFFVNGHSVATYKARGWNQTYNYAISQYLRPGKNVLAVKVRGGKKFSGITGAVWMDVEQKFEQQIDLSGGWNAIQKDYLTAKPFSAPGAISGKYLVRKIKIPAAWADKPVYLHVDTDDQWLGSIVINGQPINYSAALHPYGLRTEVNLAPYFKAGQTNTIELWPFRTIPIINAAEVPDDVKMGLQRVFLGPVADDARQGS